MSSKSILSISLDVEETFRDEKELKNLQITTGQKKGFAGWTYWAEIGSVYNIQQNYGRLFSVLDNAAEYFLPIRYRFKDITLRKDLLSVNYFPEDANILINFRKFTEL